MATHWRSSFRPLLLLLAVLLARHTCVQAADKANATQPAADDPVVKAEKEAGDIVPQGACTAEITAYCSDLPTGNRSLERCLSTQVKMVMAGKVKANPEFSAECLLEIRNFKIALYKDISMNKEMVEACKEDIASFCDDSSLHSCLPLFSSHLVCGDSPLAYPIRPFLPPRPHPPVEACKEDIASFCDDDFLYPEPGNVLACLRESKESGRVSDQCAIMVFEAQEDAADDFRMDPQLNMLCSKDADTYCGDVQSGEGRIQECLLNMLCSKDADTYCGDVQSGEGRIQECLVRDKWRALGGSVREGAIDLRMDLQLNMLCFKDATPTRRNRKKLNWECQAELFRQEVENADDIRLNVRLFRACLDDKRRFCPDVLPGDARVKDCLEEHRSEPEFSKTCKAEFDKMMERRAVDFRLDASLRKYCHKDIVEVRQGRMVYGAWCMAHGVWTMVEVHVQYTLHGTHHITHSRAVDFRLNASLRKYCHKDIVEVHRLTKRAAEDIRFDHPLHDACQLRPGEAVQGPDQEKLCKDVPSGHARVTHRKGLRPVCRAALFDQEIRYAGDLDFKFAMRQACADEMKRLCSKGEEKAHGMSVSVGVSVNQPDMVKCLQDHVADADMGKACADAVKRTSSAAHRLRGRAAPLHNACAPPASRAPWLLSAAAAGQACGGAVLKCLSEKVSQLQNAECREEVFYFERRTVEDPALDVPLQQACKDDADMYCGAGAGYAGRDHSRTLSCLRQNRKKLSAKCKAEELRFTAMEPHALLPAADRKKLSAKCKAEELRFTAMEVVQKRFSGDAARVHWNAGAGHGSPPLFLSPLDPPFPSRHHQASDIRLTPTLMNACIRHPSDPTLMNACGLELHQFCRGVPPMGGHAFRCLQWHIQEPGMSACRAGINLQAMRQSQCYRTDIALLLRCDPELRAPIASGMSVACRAESGMSVACRAEVDLQTMRQSQYYRTDIALQLQCNADVEEKCSEGGRGGGDVNGGQEAEGDYGPILRCLLQSYQTLKPACQSEVTYVVRNALWMYHSNAPLTKPCHTDIDTLCNSTNVAGFSEHKGAVMVGVVAGSGGHVGGLVNENQLEDTLTKIAEIQLVAQAEAEEQAEGSPLVLTGWLAFIAITALAALLLGGGFFIYRRYFDPRRNYTVVVKAGDV
ncbi:unnamed protein product [Closterium sp. NIES-64]|nr:unnamed protein product [Closterium sp. NIES-64]